MVAGTGQNGQDGKEFLTDVGKENVGTWSEKKLKRLYRIYIKNLRRRI
jgi:hypothetical protein